MVYIWRALVGAFNSPGALLVFHQFFYWAAVAVFSTAVVRSLSGKLLVFLVIGFCPPLFITSLHIWKDVGMLSAMGLATASVFCYVRNPRLSWMVLAVVSLMYAVLVRINGFVSVIPLIIFLAVVVLKSTGLAELKKWLGVMSFVVCFVVACFSTLKIANSGATKSYGIGTLIVWDMVSISLAEKHDYIPPYLPRAESKNLLMDLAKANSREANYPSYAVVSPYPPEANQKELIRDWLALVLAHPEPYLKHRTHVFLVLLGMHGGEIYYPFHPGIDENEFGLRLSHLGTVGTEKVLRFFNTASKTVFYRPWIYFLLSGVVLVAACIRLVARKGRSQANALAAVVSVSGLLTVLALFIVATAADYRYITWMIMASLMSFMILVSDAFSECAARPPAVQK